MKVKTPGEVLTNPADWPSDLVQRAVETIEERMLGELKSIGEVAAVNRWFDEDH